MFITMMKNIGLNMYIGNMNKRKLMKEITKIVKCFIGNLILPDIKVVKVMDKNISATIVNEIIADIYGRYGLEQYFRSLNPKIQVEMYENWIRIVSTRLHEEGLIEERYEPIKTEEMSFAEIVNRSSHYLEDD